MRNVKATHNFGAQQNNQRIDHQKKQAKRDERNGQCQQY